MLRPLSLRRRMAMDVSNMGVLKSTTGTASVNPAAFLAEASSAKAPTRKPKGKLPESPRKIFAGGQLNSRNPTRAPERIVASRHISALPCHQAIAATVNETISPTEPASPSRPSTRFTKFAQETSHKRLMGMASHEKSKSHPNRCAAVVDCPKQTKGNMAATCH